MKVIAAYLLAVLGGNLTPSAEDLKQILGSGVHLDPAYFLIHQILHSLNHENMVHFYAVGAEADDDRIEFLLSEVKGKDITELIASGREKLASVPSGGGVAVSAAAPAAGGASAPAADAEAKEEKKVEEKEESDDVSRDIQADPDSRGRLYSFVCLLAGHGIQFVRLGFPCVKSFVAHRRRRSVCFGF